MLGPKSQNKIALLQLIVLYYRYANDKHKVSHKNKEQNNGDYFAKK